MKEPNTPGMPHFSTYYRVKKTKEVGEWVSATSRLGTFELKMLDGAVIPFHRTEIEPISNAVYLKAQKKSSS